MPKIGFIVQPLQVAIVWPIGVASERWGSLNAYKPERRKTRRSGNF
jgi:hypothetical protein